MNTIKKIERLANLREEVETLQKEIAHEQKVCQHVWGKVEDASYHAPVDEYDGHSYYRYVRHTLIKRWKRECTKCTQVQYTEREKCVKTAPDFGD